MPACAKTWATAWVAVVLPAPGEADDADDAAWARRGFAHHRLLLVRERELVGSLDLVEPLLADRGRAGVAAALDERERRTLDVDELGRRVAGRTARGRRFTDLLDAIGPGEPGREPAHPVGGGAGAVCLRPGHHGFGVGERGLLLGQSLRAEHPRGRSEAARRGTAPGGGRARAAPRSSRAPSPCSAARARQSSRSRTRSTCSFRSRVSTAATWAA